jgi:ribosome biogenesis GTPase A
MGDMIINSLIARNLMLLRIKKINGICSIIIKKNILKIINKNQLNTPRKINNRKKHYSTKDFQTGARRTSSLI